MHYYLYQTRNTVNDKVYVGVHQTEDLNDGYLGSGVALQHAIEKYGVEAFEKTVLETFESADAMYAREAEVVDEAFLAREDVYNLKVGGSGGWDYVNNHIQSKSWRRMGGIAVKMQCRGIFGSDSTIRDRARQTLREKRLGLFNPEVQKCGAAIGQPLAVHAALSEESRTKRKATLTSIQHQQGERNSQFGKRWITNGVDNAIVHKDQPIPGGWRLGRVV